MPIYERSGRCFTKVNPGLGRMHTSRKGSITWVRSEDALSGLARLSSGCTAPIEREGFDKSTRDTPMEAGTGRILAAHFPFSIFELRYISLCDVIAHV